MTSEFGIAVHALVYLNHKQTSLTSEELAENICTHAARVRKVMAKLKKAGLVETREGVVGGYSFVLAPEQVALSAVSEALEVSFVSVSWRSGDPDMECLVASGMSKVMDGIYEELNCLCRQKLQTITIANIDKVIFQTEGGHDETF